MTPLSLGIMLGLFAAVGQALSYLPSRWFVLRHPGSMMQLLALSHVIQGVVSLPLVIYFWPADMPPLSQYAGPLVAESAFYFLGQAGLFTALRHTDASRVSPLLGVKVVILALLSTLFLKQQLTGTQWAAAMLAVMAAFILNHSGGSIPWRAGAGLLMAWTGYSLSDFFIRVYVLRMSPMDPLQAGLLGMYISYLLCGLVGVALLPWHGSRNWKDWRDALPFAMFWFGAMICFYGALATAGLVLAAILQSTRSFWSILIGVIVSRLGYHALEQRITRGVLVRRAIGTVLMVTAITLYVMQSQKKVETQEATPATVETRENAEIPSHE